jgi:hypothetical protein
MERALVRRILYKAYVEGRSATDPSENWYKDELGFFDFYMIPLAKKLDECCVCVWCLERRILELVRLEKSRGV